MTEQGYRIWTRNMIELGQNVHLSGQPYDGEDEAAALCLYYADQCGLSPGEQVQMGKRIWERLRRHEPDSGDFHESMG